MLGRLAATVAHEVRNPLGGMSTALDTVRKFGDDRAVRGRALDLIERGLWSIRDVVESVLAFHRMPLDGRKLLPADLDDLRVLVQREVSRRALRLHWRRNIEGEVAVAATETRQVALNLLLNACEVSPPGVKLHLMFRSRLGRPGSRKLTVVIADAGPGMPQQLLAALTGKDASDGLDHRNGIGLRVIRDLVHALGGRIAVAARQVGGTCITVSLPIDVPVGEVVAI